MDNYFPKTQSGLTLIELMIVIVIVGILTSLAAPSFVSVTQRFRALGEINAFGGDLLYARSEAIKAGADVVICAANTTSTDCSSSNTWHLGWIVYSVPDTGTGVKKILKVQKRWASTDTMIASPTTTDVTFTRDGFAPSLSGAGVVTFVLTTTPANPFALQCMELSKQGRQQIVAKGTGACS